MSKEGKNIANFKCADKKLILRHCFENLLCILGLCQGSVAVPEILLTEEHIKLCQPPSVPKLDGLG